MLDCVFLSLAFETLLFVWSGCPASSHLAINCLLHLLAHTLKRSNPPLPPLSSHPHPQGEVDLSEHRIDALSAMLVEGRRYIARNEEHFTELAEALGCGGSQEALLPALNTTAAGTGGSQTAPLSPPYAATSSSSTAPTLAGRSGGGDGVELPPADTSEAVLAAAVQAGSAGGVGAGGGGGTSAWGHGAVAQARAALMGVYLNM